MQGAGEVKKGDLTCDRVRRYGLQVAQPADGYRFSLDALLLADFVSTAADARIMDLGTGCGIMPLILCRRFPAATAVGIDSNDAMAELARENAAGNGLEERIVIISADILDIRSLFSVSSFDCVVANPPFRTPVSGRVSPKAGRDTARHESTAGMDEFLAAAKYLVKPGGRIFMVYHTDRLAEFIHSARERKLSLLRLRMVHGSLGVPARMFLAELAKGSRGVSRVLPPLIVHDENGEYTREVCAILEQSGGGNKKGRLP